MEKEIRDLCLSIYAHAYIDSEITLCGNGTNSSEASNVADVLLKILKIKIPDREIKKAAKELAKEYGIEEDEL